MWTSRKPSPSYLGVTGLSEVSAELAWYCGGG